MLHIATERGEAKRATNTAYHTIKEERKVCSKLQTLNLCTLHFSILDEVSAAKKAKPLAEIKIKQELEAKTKENKDDKWYIFHNL